MTQAKPRFRTIEEYLNYGDGMDNTRYELVRGELVEMPPESWLNQKIAVFLLSEFLKLGLPPSLLAIGVQIAVNREEATVRQPDFVVLSPESAIALEKVTTAVITSAMPVPSLVVEVVSPGKPGSENYDRDYIEKPVEYAARGIPEFWRVDPSRAVVAVLTLRSGSYRMREFRGTDLIVSPTFPNLQLTAEQVLSAG